MPFTVYKPNLKVLNKFLGKAEKQISLQLIKNAKSNLFQKVQVGGLCSGDKYPESTRIDQSKDANKLRMNVKNNNAVCKYLSQGENQAIDAYGCMNGRIIFR